MNKIVFLAACLSTLTACITPGPDYERPDELSLFGDIELADSYSNNNEVLSQWWESFADARLNQLISDALINNRDIVSAAANLSAARANIQLARLGRVPTDQISVNPTLSRQSAAGAPFPGAGEDFEIYTATAAPTWDLDLFGSISRNIEIANANYGAQAQQLRNIQLIIIGDVASNYFTLQSQLLEQEITQRNLAIQDQSLELTLALFNNGRVSEADALNARAQRDTTAATLPAINAQIQQTRQRIAVLTGQIPKALDDLLMTRSQAASIESAIPVGDFSQLVRRQPAIQAAERALAASVAEIGLSISDMFPRLTLVGSIGVSAQEPSDLTDNNALQFSIGPNLSWSLSNLLRGRQAVAAAEARSQAAFADYEQAILQALNDLQSALVLQSSAQDRRELLEASVQASFDAAEIARIQYEQGAVPFNAVLDAEARLLERELEAGRNEYDLVNSQVSVFRALGAG